VYAVIQTSMENCTHLLTPCTLCTVFCK